MPSPSIDEKAKLELLAELLKARLLSDALIASVDVQMIRDSELDEAMLRVDVWIDGADSSWFWAAPERILARPLVDIRDRVVGRWLTWKSKSAPSSPSTPGRVD